MVRRPDLKDQPYCGNCGYQLTGLTESSKCPECGKPLVEVLTRNPLLGQGKRWRSRLELGGWPLIDIAMGPHGGELRGHAKGIVAIGDIATGAVAVGGMARGVVALGGMSIGLFTVGGMSLGLLCAWGGVAVGGIACGGTAIGLLAMGGLAMGYMAAGGEAFGLHTLGAAGYSSPEAQRVLGNLGLMAGEELLSAIARILVWPVLATILIGGAIAGYALARVRGDHWRKAEDA